MGQHFKKDIKWVLSNAHLTHSIVSVGDDANALGRDNKKVSVRLFHSLIQISHGLHDVNPAEKEGGYDAVQGTAGCKDVCISIKSNKKLFWKKSG